MTIDTIKKHLERGDTIEVCSIWRYTGKYMRCSEDNCCEYDFDTIDEAVEDIMDKADNRTEDITLYFNGDE